MNDVLNILDGIPTDARFATLDDSSKQRVETWRLVMRAVLQGKPRGKAMAEQAARLRHVKGFSESQIERAYYKLMDDGNWVAAFTDNRGRTQRSGTVTDSERELFRKYAGENQRGKLMPAWHRLMNDLRAGVALEGLGHDGAHGTWRDLYAREFPERRVPDVCPLDYVPRGWSYDSFYRARPTKYEMKAITVGRGEARAYRPGVMTTRVGSRVMQGIVIDDLWHDQLVNVPGVNKTAHWPLELAAIDFASGCKFAFGFKPELESDDGTRERIRTRETRFFLAHIFTTWGWSPDGTTIFAEHGAAGVEPHVEEKLREWSGGRVTVERSGIVREEAFAGLFEGRGRGNPNFKALLEGSHSYFQNAIAHLPARKGMTWEKTPAGLDKMVAYNRNLLAAMEQLDPTSAAQLILPIPLFSKWVAAVTEIYDRVNNRAAHALEGWEEQGNVVSQYRIHAHSEEWIDETDFLTLPPSTQAMLRDAVTHNPRELSRPRNLSPKEVFARGARDLVKLPVWCVPQLLGRDLGMPVRVTDSHEIECGDIYEAEALTTKNRVEPLSPGECFVGHVNPYNEQYLLLSREDGQFVGVCKRRVRVAKFDQGAMNEAVRDAMRKEAELLKPLARRGRATQQQRMEDTQWNIGLLAKASGADVNNVPFPKSQSAQVEQIDPIKEAIRRKALAAESEAPVVPA